MKKRLKERACFALALVFLLALLPGGVLAEGETAVSLVPDKTEAVVGDTVTWTVDLNGATGTLYYCFYIFLNGKIAQRGEYGPSKSCSYTVDNTGTYSVVLYVKDASGAVEQFSGGEVTVTAQPVTVSVYPERDSAGVGETVNWVAYADGGVGALQYCFYLFLNGKIAQRGEYGEADHQQFTLETPGEYTVRVYVKDAAGTTAEFTGGAVTAAWEPIDIDLQADRETAAPGDTVTWTVSADGGTGEFQYCFYLFLNGTVAERREYGETDHESFTLETPGEYSVKAYVKDSAGTTEELTGGTVTVSPAPITATLQADRETGEMGETVTWTVSAEGGWGKYRYRFCVLREGNAELESEYGEDGVCAFVPRTPGNYAIKAFVMDETGQEKEIDGGEFIVRETRPTGRGESRMGAMLWILIAAAAVVAAVVVVIVLLNKRREQGN